MSKCPLHSGPLFLMQVEQDRFIRKPFDCVTVRPPQPESPEPLMGAVSPSAPSMDHLRTLSLHPGASITGSALSLTARAASFLPAALTPKTPSGNQKGSFDFGAASPSALSVGAGGLGEELGEDDQARWQGGTLPAERWMSPGCHGFKLRGPNYLVVRPPEPLYSAVCMCG